MTIQERNRELADNIMEEAKRTPQAYPRKFVGIANGQIVLTADSLSEIARRLEQVEPDSSKTFIVEPRRDLSEVHEIWEIA